MALINCPECNKEVSDKAELCIHCGCPLNDKEENKNSKNSEIKKGFKINKKIILSFVGVLVLIIGLIYVMFFSTPYLKGKTLNKAIEILKEKNLNYSVDFVYVNDCKVNTVIKQDCKFLYPLSKISDIDLTVCKGYYVDVNDLVNKQVEDVLEALSELSPDFIIKKIYVSSNTAELGSVLKIESNGCVNQLVNVPSDSEIIITVCDKIMKEVPCLKGKTEKEAIEIISQLGLEAKIDYEYKTNIDKGIVMAWDKYYIENGDKEVLITISKGVDNRLSIPCTIGKEVKDAKSELTSLGCTVSVEYIYKDIDYYDVSCTVDVISEQDIYGKTEDENPKVTLTVYKRSIAISSISFDTNSAGGVDTEIYFKNISDKKIKYVSFDCNYYDRVGESAYCSITGNSNADLQYTGPLNAGEKATPQWNAVIYNYSVAALKPVIIKVTFIDNSVQELNCNGRYWYSSDYYGGDLCD